MEVSDEGPDTNKSLKWSTLSKCAVCSRCLSAYPHLILYLAYTQNHYNLQSNSLASVNWTTRPTENIAFLSRTVCRVRTINLLFSDVGKIILIFREGRSGIIYDTSTLRNKRPPALASGNLVIARLCWTYFRRTKFILTLCTLYRIKCMVPLGI